MVRPTTISLAPSPARARTSVARGGAAARSWFQTRNTNAKAMPRRAWMGMTGWLKGGAMSIIPLSLMRASRATCTWCGATAKNGMMVMLLGVVPQAHDEVLGEVDHVAEHPWAEGEQDQDRRRHLRDEGERLLLDLRHRLQDRGEQPGQRAHEQDGAHQHEGRPQGLAREVDDGFGGHW